jgi:hypothetical protein
MSSKGSPIKPIRFSESLLEEIMGALKSANRSRQQEEYDFSEWVRQACREKLGHLARSKKPRRAKDGTERGIPLKDPNQL